MAGRCRSRCAGWMLSTAPAGGSARVRESSALARGPQIVRFEQQHAGRPVFNRALNVLMSEAGHLGAISGEFADVDAASPATLGLDAAAALSGALRLLGGGVAPSSLRWMRAHARRRPVMPDDLGGAPCRDGVAGVVDELGNGCATRAISGGSMTLIALVMKLSLLALRWRLARNSAACWQRSARRVPLR